uniref:Uncharacterized protein n=1 Tax=Hordeum vulgare subsp. vulgare TaxID=112509 RepID=A0A8I6WR43_HORVV
MFRCATSTLPTELWSAMLDLYMNNISTSTGDERAVSCPYKGTNERTTQTSSAQLTYLLATFTAKCQARSGLRFHRPNLARWTLAIFPLFRSFIHR